MKALVKLQDVSKIYELGESRIRALDDVTVVIREGEMIAVMGPSGSGKSTFVHIAGLLDRPTKGGVYLKGKRVDDMNESEKAKVRNREVGFVFQQFNLLPRISSWENVALPLVYAGVPEHERLKRASEVMSRLGLLHRRDHSRGQLSGGEQQRVAIARALVNNPSIIFADEPTGNLDSVSGMEVMELLHKLHMEGKTIVLVTHEAQVASYAQRIINLADGKMTSDRGTKKRTMRRP